MDPLDWTHQWEDFEMFMYVQGPAEADAGIYMQVSRCLHRSGADEWDILYDRKIADLDDVPVDADAGTEAWEERVLRDQLRDHPKLVDEEKAFLQTFLNGGT